ncbi:MAG: hypothetical protein A3B47_03900 [Candidatus Levybacteria bacterium RIFCSPLOWO2_01_FULL_39_24]|nr:MAG: hypothetical protein A2800_03705 [Candidatus Levybacteria bacterium RIFCSPHIGHO2_01_FULL_40_16]OGH46379.1 MAG: hypothetical protein A3B47_03900 [Candidatus Levybacteria bacterium RIFCSPLOWO2_01_FULL_39_24]
MNNNYNLPEELEAMLLDFYMMPAKKRYVSDDWVNKINNGRVAKLAATGYENFGHTLAIDYCAWLEDPSMPGVSKLLQSKIDYLCRNLGSEEIAKAKKVAKKIPPSPYAAKDCNFITLLLWQYVKNQGLQKESKMLSESSEGDPTAINFEGKLISQGLGYSLLEYDTIRKNTDINSIKSIMSIGPGYGRTAYVFLRLLKVQKYILIDIPPALYVAQRYLENLLPEKKIFKYRKFTSFREIEEEFEKAEIVFLMPWQIELLPEKCIDLITAILSFDDMDIRTIKRYLKHINTLGKRYFYLKTWKEWTNENKIIKWKESCPIPKSWKTLVYRSCRAQADYSEKLYKLPRHSKLEH